MNQPLKAFVIHNPKTLYNPQPFGYSHIAEVTHFQRILHISGQGGENSEGILSPHFTLQVEQALKNIELALAHVQATLQDIAVLRVLVVAYDAQKHQILIQHMQEYWNDVPFPACTLIPVPCLAMHDMLIEIEATAYCTNTVK